jgi:hypothetical protein
MEDQVRSKTAVRGGGPATAAAGGNGSSCPSWCTQKAEHAEPGSHVHRSAERQVPVTPHWWCLDMGELDADLRCTAGGITAFLTMADSDGRTEVVLQHGDMELPHVSLGAAEQLARHLSQLVLTAR